MTTLARAEFHQFHGAEADYLYLVPSAGVVKLDDTTRAVLDALGENQTPARELAARVASFFPMEDVRSAIEELLTVRAIRTVEAAPPPPSQPVVAAEAKKKRSIPLSTLVLNVTSKCNLSCGYCYEYGEDRLVQVGTKPRFMNEETAKKSVDFMFAESGDMPVVNLTFFGGETLLRKQSR
jgi:uncharacterized protein